MMENQPLQLDVSAGVATLTLNRPDASNAIDESVMAAFEEHLDRVASDETVRVVVLTGAGRRSFCGGGDLNWFRTLKTPEAGRAMSERMRGITDRLADGNRPLVTVANGAAIGGGLELFLCGHVRIAAADARFAFRQATVGVVTGFGGATRGMEALGPDRFRELAITGRTFTADQALAFGVVHEVTPVTTLLRRADEVAAGLASQVPGAVAAFLQLTRTWTREGHDATSMEELRAFEALWPPPNL